jgi:5-aminolevulinate synthase
MRAMSLSYHDLFQHKIDALKEKGNYRQFADLQRHTNLSMQAIHRPCDYAQRDITVWCSNDYLGMGQHPDVIAAMGDATKFYGAGSGGTRNISGTSHAHITLEKDIAALHDKESALVFSSGYVANQTALSTLGKLLPGCVIFSDEKNHASMIEGIRHSGCEKHIFRHNDLAHLESLLQSVPRDTPKIIAFESVYSMDGDIGPLAGFIQLAKTYHALTYLDEVHAVGLYGPTGGGIAQRDHLHHQIDIINGTLGKAFGVMGGYIAGNAVLIDAVRSYGSGFIFTTSLPPAICAAASTSIHIVRNTPSLRNTHQAKVMQLKQALTIAGIPHKQTDTHIVPVMVEDAALCRTMSDMLLYTHHIYVQPINYPTVPWGTERLRITPSPLHRDEDIAHLVRSLGHVFDTHLPEKLLSVKDAHIADRITHRA